MADTLAELDAEAVDSAITSVLDDIDGISSLKNRHSDFCRLAVTACVLLVFEVCVKMSDFRKDKTEALDGRNEPKRRKQSQSPGAMVAAYCPFCPFVTWTGPAELSHHLRSHLGTQHCPVCGVSAASKPALHQHIARRHIRPDHTYQDCEDYLTDVPDACLMFCEVCRLVTHCDRRVFSHCCFLCDYSDPNPLELYRHVIMGHVQIAKSREANEAGRVQQNPGEYSFESQIKGGGQKCCLIPLKPAEEAEKQGDGQRTPSHGPRRYGKRKSPSASPPSTEPTHTSLPALPVKNRARDVIVPLKKRRKISLESDDSENYLHTFRQTPTVCEKDTKASNGLMLGPEQQIQGRNVEAITSGVTYDVGFCSMWVPMPLLEQEVPLDLSLRKAPPADFNQSAMPVITSVFSWKDYI
ncbi:Hypp2940 [Branchiostoma lanceolatum]|uniref:Hypp2940 protein n=1 Tax=Branchiostoma lanceolatum TaxID=7740 RepID=A0A8K0EVM4_BRALA|nr:Hypp2940 [Branchiostoma lanceolatum]